MPASVRPFIADRDSPRIAHLMREYGFPRTTDDGMRDYLTPKPAQTRLTLVAVDSATGAWIGFTNLNVSKDGSYAQQGMTGVLRPYRGRKIALALKLLSIQHARSRGVLEIRTGNDSRNAPILAINRKLGFVLGRGQCSLLKRFTG